jgi:molybdopterin converting factor small subunit/ectoine hydroxylase-related dioxygenase (phytanoyl-CoA dioxygenase family)
MATVRIPPVLRPKTGGEGEVEAAGATVGEVLEGLAAAHPETRGQLFSDDGELNRYVNVYLNDEDVRVLDGLETAVSDSDTVVILPAMAGGSLKRTVAGRLRESKATWVAHNLLHYRSLRRNAGHYKELEIEKPLVGSVAHRDIGRHSEEVPWLDRPDAAAQLAASREAESFPAQIRAKLAGWIEDGYMVLEGHLSPAEVEEINADLEHQFEQGRIKYHPLGKRVVNAFEHSEPVRRAVTDPELLRLLSFILGREVNLFQTIDFFVGSEQAAHSDSFHMTTEPIGYLIAIWVALEDVDPESGPVFYYPGSHKLPYVMTEDLGEGGDLGGGKEARYAERIRSLIADRNLEPVEFTAKAGDVLIWHANLLHGGRAIAREGATRKSLVAHYFGSGVLCYHEVTERPAIVRA